MRKRIVIVVILAAVALGGGAWYYRANGGNAGYDRSAYRNADGSAGRRGSAYANGPNGGTASTSGGISRDADGNVTGARSTTATGAKVNYQSDLAKVSVVGVGMKTHTGVAQRMFKALADNKVNIQNITTSEIKISCIIDKEQAAKALQVVHDAFELEKAK